MRAIDRIRALADWLVEKKVVKSITQFENVCGMSPKYIRNLRATEKGNPGVETIAGIYDVFPSVSLKWLVTGKGGMFPPSKNEDELVEKMRLDIIAREVLAYISVLPLFSFLPCYNRPPYYITMESDLDVRCQVSELECLMPFEPFLWLSLFDC